MARWAAGPRDAVRRTTMSLTYDGVIAAAVTRTPSDTDRLRAVAVLSPTFGPDGALRAVYGMMIPPSAFASATLIPAFDGPPLMEMWAEDGHLYTNREMVNLQ